MLSTCSDWSSTTGTGAVAGNPLEVVKGPFWANTIGMCSLPYYLVCLEQ